MVWASQVVLVVKKTKTKTKKQQKKTNPPANAGDIRDLGLIPGLGKSPGRGDDIPLQYSCLKKPMDRGA